MTAPLTLRFGAAESAEPSVLPVPLDTLLRTRLLVQANSGGGKSHALRALLEQTHGAALQIVLDPEGEFATLREEFGFVLAGRDGDVPAHPKIARVLCRRVVEARANIIIDLYDLPVHERREFVKLFLTELMALPRALWTPTLVVLDEAHVFCPERGSGESQSTDAVITLCTQGRKRGFCAVLATQRISKLHKDAAAELLNKLIGRTGLDVDMRRAGAELGMDRETWLQLRDLRPGEFYAFGPALGGRVTRVRSGAVRSRHPDGSAPVPVLAAASASVEALVAKLGDIPAQAEAEARTVETLERELQQLRAQLRQKAAARVIDQDAIAAAVASVERGVSRRLQQIRDDLQAAVPGLERALARVQVMLSEPTPAGPPLPAPTPAPPARPEMRTPQDTKSSTDSAPLSNTQRRMLAVLVQLEALGVTDPERRTMAGWAGVSHTTGTFSNQLRGMRDAGCIVVQGDRVQLTDAGRANASPTVPITSLAQLHDVWASKFSSTVARMFRELLTLSGPSLRPVSKASLAAAVGVSHTTGTFSNQLRELRSPGVIETVDAQLIRLTPLVFPAGLA